MALDRDLTSAFTMSRSTDAKTRILDVALDLFHAQGVKATGLDQILKASETGKSQFYHYFEDKDDLVLAVMHHFVAKLTSGEIPLKRDLSSLRDLEDWFRFFIGRLAEIDCSRSCPIGTIASEFDDSSEELRSTARAIFEKSREPLVKLFDALKSKQQLKRGVESHALADFCFTIMQGGMLISKVERNSAAFENAVDQALAHIRSLRP